MLMKYTRSCEPRVFGKGVVYGCWRQVYREVFTASLAKNSRFAKPYATQDYKHRDLLLTA